MAYVNFSPELIDQQAIDGRVASPAEAARFTSIELHVIAAAEREDATRELSPHSRLGWFLQWAFGIELKRPLANPRLETLRRFASLASHHPARVGETDLRQFVEAGYSPGQATGLLDYFSGRRMRATRAA